VSVAPIKCRCGSGFITEDGELIPVDVALPLLHGDGGEDGTVQGALRCAGIKFVGCDTLTGALSLDKGYTKLVCEHCGIPTARWSLVIKGSERYTRERAAADAEERLGYPLFVKAAGLGSSVGVFRVERRNELFRAIDEASVLGGGRVLVEEAIDLECELECAVLFTKDKRIISSPAEIRCADGFYDFEHKYRSESCASSRTTATPETIGLIKEYTERLAEALGTRHLSRFDYFLSKNGELFFNEVNTLPGFTASSMYAHLIENEGITARELIALLLTDALG
jgi:D-alanine-D-alanine ligase